MNSFSKKQVLHPEVVAGMDTSHVSLTIAQISCNIPHPSSLCYGIGKSVHQKYTEENQDTDKNRKVHLKKIVPSY